MLDLNGTPLRKMEETSFQNMQCLRRLDISSALNPTHLSFSGCLSLGMFRIGSQPNLQVLNLPGAVIKQFPSEMSTMEQLRCLYSSDTKTRGGHFRHVFAQAKHIPPPSYQNHLEISGGNNFPHSIDGVLFAKESLHLHDNGFISTVSGMNMKNMNKLKHCCIERCSQLQSIVVGKNEDEDALESLESTGL